MNANELITLLKEAREDIFSLRVQNERMSIRLTAIDDFLGVLHGKPGTKSEVGKVENLVWRIDQTLAAAERNGSKK